MFEGGQAGVNGTVTARLSAWRRGDDRAMEPVMPELYAALRAIARQRLRSESSTMTIDATDLVHEAMLRVMGNDKEFANRSHFLAIGALYMRSILIDRARAVRAGRHGAITLTTGRVSDMPVPGDNLDLIMLDDALTLLEAEDERSARVLELTVFAGLPREAIAALLEVSVATVDRDLRFARAWLRRAVG